MKLDANFHPNLEQDGVARVSQRSSHREKTLRLRGVHPRNSEDGAASKQLPIRSTWSDVALFTKFKRMRLVPSCRAYRIRESVIHRYACLYWMAARAGTEYCISQ